MAISIVQMAEIGRILGYPNISPKNSLNLEYPTFASQFGMWQPYAVLINRLSGASAYNEVQYLGAESSLFGTFFTPAAIALTVSTPSSIVVGVTVNLNAGGTVLSYITRAGDTPASVAAALSALVAENATVAAIFMPNPTGATLNLYNISAIGTDGNGVTCIATSSDPSCTLSFGATEAQMAYGQTSGGQVPPGPQFTPTGTTETVFGFVPIIHILESDLVNARQNLDTLSADVWNPRQDELDVRYALLTEYKRQLANAISVPLDPDLVGNRRSSHRIV